EVPPPGVFRGRRRHVVGHDVHDDPHRALPQLLAELCESLPATEVRADPGRIDYVIAMVASRRRLQDGRRVKMGHAKLGEVPAQPGGRAEIEARGQLDAVGGSGRQGLTVARIVAAAPGRAAKAAAPEVSGP